MIDIRIRSLELKDTETLEGVIDRVKTIVTIEGTSMFKNFSLNDPDPQSFQSLENVTEDLVKEWIKPHFEQELPQVKAQVLAQNKQKEKTAVKEVDPQTGEISYTREKHIKEWKPGKTYKVGESFYYTWETTETIDGEEVTTEHSEFYKALQPHTSQADWKPTDVAALYSSTFIFKGDYARWKQPQGAHDAYPQNFEVKHGNSFYRSLVPANVWQPGTDSSLWVEIDPDAPKLQGSSSYTVFVASVGGGVKVFSGESSVQIDSEGLGSGSGSAELSGSSEGSVLISQEGAGQVMVSEGSTYGEWVQPTGGHNAYATGDIVSYNGEPWISKISSNTTVPDGDEPYNRYWEPYVI